MQTYLDAGLDGVSPRTQRERWTLNLIALMVCQSGLSYAVFYLIYDAAGLWPAAVVVSLFTLFIFVPALTRRNLVLGMAAGSALTIVLQSALAWLLGTASGLHLFMLSVPAILVVCGGTRTVWIIGTATFAAAAAMIGCGLAFQDPAPFMSPDPVLLAILRSSSYFVLAGFVLIGVYLGFARANAAEDALEAEHARSEALLYNLLPEDIAARLKVSPDQAIADSLDHTAILFADIVGFAPQPMRCRAACSCASACMPGLRWRV